MKKVLYLLVVLLVCCLGLAEAGITDVKWGVDAKKNLRVVIDLTDPADFTMDLQEKFMVIKVSSPLQGENRMLKVKSDFTDSVGVKAEGTRTEIRLPLSHPLARGDIKAFTLKKDPVTKRPARIVFDLLQKPVPGAVESQKQIAKIPEIKRKNRVAAKPKVAAQPAIAVKPKATTTQPTVVLKPAATAKPAADAAVKPAVAVVPAVTDVLPGAGKKDKPKKEKTTKSKRNNPGEYKTGGGIKGKVITIDPGHGGSDPGAVSKKGTYEKTITLSMAKKLKEDLEEMGAVVYLTRSRDTDVAGQYADDEKELQARVNIAENHASDLFISLHINASVNHKASGISTYFYPKTKHDQRLAKCIHKQLTDHFGLNDMGVRQANFYVTKRCQMPAVLMELGFITNAKEEKTIKGNWFQNKAMDLVAKGIRDYFK